jgi:hypothetical protein
VPLRFVEAAHRIFIPAPQNVVLGLDRPRPFGPGLSGLQCTLTQDLVYGFPRNPFVGSSVNRRISSGTYQPIG